MNKSIDLNSYWPQTLVYFMSYYDGVFLDPWIRQQEADVEFCSTRLSCSSRGRSFLKTFLLRRAWSISDSILERLTHDLSESQHVKLTRFSQRQTENLFRVAATSLTSDQLPSRSRLSDSAGSGSRNQNQSTEKIGSAVSGHGGPEERVMGMWECQSRYEAGMSCQMPPVRRNHSYSIYKHTRGFLKNEL